MKEILWSRVIKAASGKRILNSLKVVTASGLSAITKKSFIWGVPFILTVEPTVLCNLHCPQCVTGIGKVNREQNSLSLNCFENIIEQIGDKIWYLLLYNQGEPFLNPHLINLINIAKRKRIYVTTSTNGHFLTDEDNVQKLVASGLDTIIISLDGADAETYLKYRQGANFQQVISGIKKLVKMRDRFNSRTPKILVQCLVMKHNEDQLAQIRELVHDLKADRLLLKTFQIESRDSGEHFLPNNPKWRRYQIKGETIDIKNPLKNRCSRLWYSTVILSDGRIVPCCFDKNGEYAFGVLTQKTKIEKIWKSDAYNKFRTRILQRQESIRICHNCTQNQKVFLKTSTGIYS